jgi:DNA-binding transcriptional MerR regulator
MALAQQSLFDFFDDPPANKPAAKAVLPVVKKVEEIIVVNEEPVEVEFATVAVEEIIEEEAIEDTVTIFTEKKSTRGRQKLSDMDAGLGLVEVPEDGVLFAKKYYSIGVVANMFKVNVSLIRFWEKEFDMLKPKLNGKGDRHFRPEDVKILKQIHHLLREKKYTIEGARAFLKQNKKSEESFAVVEELEKLKTFLIDLKLSL